MARQRQSPNRFDEWDASKQTYIRVNCTFEEKKKWFAFIGKHKSFSAWCRDVLNAECDRVLNPEFFAETQDEERLIQEGLCPKSGVDVKICLCEKCRAKEKE